MLVITSFAVYEMTKGPTVIRIYVSFMTAVALVALFGTAHAKPNWGKPHKAWYDIRLSGQRLGYAKAVDERIAVRGRPTFHISRWEKLTIKRLGETLTIDSTTEGWFAPDGTPMRFKHQRSEGQEKRGVEGHRDGNVMIIRRMVGGNRVEKKVPINNDLRLASSLEVLLAEQLKVGLKLEGRALDETQGDVLPYKIEVTGRTKDGLFLVKQSLGPITAQMQMAADGTLVRSVLPDIGIQQIKVTEAEALMPPEVVDLFSKALVQLPGPLPERHRIEKLIVRLRSKSGRKIEGVQDDRQQVKSVKGGIELTIRTQDAPIRPARRPVKDRRWQAFLQSTDYEPLDAPDLRAAAARLAKGKSDVWAVARSINRFVHGHIQNKSLARGYMSAPEALSSREGDCTEHSVLFSALAKISGIPTRLVTGLVYVGGPTKHVLGYHEWVEIWTGKEWLAMDPTFGQDIADATHIKLHAGLSDPKGLREAGTAAGRALHDFEFEVVAFVDASGKRHPL